MKIHTLLTNDFEPGREDELNIKNSVCAVIDTIRATSTIATMLGCGGSNVLIASDKKEALSLKGKFSDFILCGEEKGLPPAGFDYGNSPLEISEIDCKGKNFILMTTNGTRSILKVKDCSKIYTMSILNLYNAVDTMVQSALENSMDMILLCSGERGKIAYDDAYTAGLAIKYILTKPYRFEFSDSSKLVLAAALSEYDINDALEKSCSARSLRAVGLGKDIAFLSAKNRYRVCPELKTAIILNDVNSFKFKFIKRPAAAHKELLYIITP